MSTSGVFNKVTLIAVSAIVVGSSGALPAAAQCPPVGTAADIIADGILDSEIRLALDCDGNGIPDLFDNRPGVRAAGLLRLDGVRTFDIDGLYTGAGPDGFRDAGLQDRVGTNQPLGCTMCVDGNPGFSPVRSPINSGRLTVLYLADTDGFIDSGNLGEDDSLFYVGIDIFNNNPRTVGDAAFDSWDVDMSIDPISGPTLCDNGVLADFPGGTVGVPFDVDGDGLTQAATRWDQQIIQPCNIEQVHLLDISDEEYRISFFTCAPSLEDLDTGGAELPLAIGSIFVELREGSLNVALDQTGNWVYPVGFGPTDFLESYPFDGQSNVSVESLAFNNGQTDVEFIIRHVDTLMYAQCDRADVDCYGDFVVDRFRFAQGAIRTRSDADEDGDSEDFITAAWFAPIPDLEVKKEVRCEGDDIWLGADPNGYPTLPVAPPATVEFRLTVENTGNIPLDVTLLDEVTKACDFADLDPVDGSLQVFLTGQRTVIMDGGNGINESALGGDDAPPCPAGPGAVLITPGENCVLESTPGGDDFVMAMMYVDEPITPVNADCLSFDFGFISGGFLEDIRNGVPSHLGWLCGVSACAEPAMLGDKVEIIFKAEVTKDDDFCTECPEPTIDFTNAITAYGDSDGDGVFEVDDDDNDIDTLRENGQGYDDNVVFIDAQCFELRCTKEWNARWDADADCEPDPDAWVPGPTGDQYTDLLDLRDIVFPAIITMRMTVENFASAPADVVVTDPLLCGPTGCVNTTPGVSFVNPATCEICNGVLKTIAGGGSEVWTCSIRVDTAEAMRALADCDGTPGYSIIEPPLGNGTANSTAIDDDEQKINPGQGTLPGDVIVRPGPDTLLATIPGGDDIAVMMFENTAEANGGGASICGNPDGVATCEAKIIAPPPCSLEVIKKVICIDCETGAEIDPPPSDKIELAPGSCFRYIVTVQNPDMAIVEPLVGDGLANTTAQGDDVQIVDPGAAVMPGYAIVTPGPNGVLDTAPGGDDIIKDNLAKLPRICIEDDLDCKSWRLTGTCAAEFRRFGGSTFDVTGCICPTFSAGLGDGQEKCYWFDGFGGQPSCGIGDPWLAPGDQLEISFDMQVDPDFNTEGADPDCVNHVRVEGYTEACVPGGQPDEDCAEVEAEAEVNVLVACVRCEKTVAVDLAYDPNDPNAIEYPAAGVVSLGEIGAADYPIRLIYTYDVTAGCELPLASVEICDIVLCDAVTASGASLGTCAFDASCCASVGPLDPNQSASITCEVVIANEAQGSLFFTSLSECNGNPGFTNEAQVTATPNYTGICHSGDAQSVGARCSATVCLSPIDCCPPLFKAKFYIWNQNEVSFSGTERCICSWEQFFLSDEGGHFLLPNLQTDFGRARVDGMRSIVCDDPPFFSEDVPLLGVIAKLMEHNSDRLWSGSPLIGMGLEAGEFIITEAGPVPPNPAQSDGLPPETFKRFDDESPPDTPEQRSGIDRADTAEKGSLIVYPKVEIRWNAAGDIIQDTFITLANDWPAGVNIKMVFANGNGALCNWVDNEIALTMNEPAYWSVFTGLPKGVSPFTVLDGLGEPDDDPTNPGGRKLRGYILAWAVDAFGREISWNHLHGNATLLDYSNGAAWEYSPWNFTALATATEGALLNVPYGRLDLDTVEYEAVPDQLAFTFFAPGAVVQSDGQTVTITDTDLTLMAGKQNYAIRPN